MQEANILVDFNGFHAWGGEERGEGMLMGACDLHQLRRGCVGENKICWKGRSGRMNKVG